MDELTRMIWDKYSYTVMAKRNADLPNFPIINEYAFGAAVKEINEQRKCENCRHASFCSNPMFDDCKFGGSISKDMFCNNNKFELKESKTTNKESDITRQIYLISQKQKQIQDQIFREVIKERNRQESIHPPFESNFEAVAVLGEEFGELAQAVYDTEAGGKNAGVDRIKEEAIQVIAVCVKLLEKLGNERN